MFWFVENDTHSMFFFSGTQKWGQFVFAGDNIYGNKTFVVYTVLICYQELIVPIESASIFSMRIPDRLFIQLHMLNLPQLLIIEFEMKNDEIVHAVN